MMVYSGGSGLKVSPTRKSWRKLHSQMSMSKQKNKLRVGKLNVRTVNSIGKLKNLKLKMKRLNVNISGHMRN